jgi:hypothetical protein
VNVEQGESGRGRKRDREKWINRVRDRALEIFGNSMGYKNDGWNQTPEYCNKLDKWNKCNINQMGFK